MTAECLIRRGEGPPLETLCEHPTVGGDDQGEQDGSHFAVDRRGGAGADGRCREHKRHDDGQGPHGGSGDVGLYTWPTGDGEAEQAQGTEAESRPAQGGSLLGDDWRQRHPGTGAREHGHREIEGDDVTGPRSEPIEERQRAKHQRGDGGAVSEHQDQNEERQKRESPSFGPTPRRTQSGNGQNQCGETDITD